MLSLANRLLGYSSEDGIAVTALGLQYDTANQSSYTFSVNPGGSGLLCVAIAAQDAASRNFTGATFDGSAMASDTTKVVSVSTVNVAIASIAVATASAKNLVVNFDFAVDRCGIVPFLVTGLTSSTPSGYLKSTNFGSTSATINGPAAGFSLMAVAIGGNAGPSPSWTPTPDETGYTTFSPENATSLAAAAFVEPSAGNKTASWTNSGRNARILASWS